MKLRSNGMDHPIWNEQEAEDGPDHPANEQTHILPAAETGIAERRRIARRILRCVFPSVFWSSHEADSINLGGVGPLDPSRQMAINSSQHFTRESTSLHDYLASAGVLLL